MNCKVLDVKAFLTVLDAGSFQNAAQQLNMSQPTVSRRVKALETVLGPTLLQTTTRRSTLTSVGAKLEPSLRRMVVEFESCGFLVGTIARGPARVTDMPTLAAAASAERPVAMASAIMSPISGR